MTIKASDVAKRLKALGYNADETENENYLCEIEYALAKTVQYIKNFCNIKEIPFELFYVAVDMAAGEFLKEKLATGCDVCDNIDFDAEGIKTITEGDVTIQFGTGEGTGEVARYKDLIKSLCYRDAELVPFRKLRW